MSNQNNQHVQPKPTNFQPADPHIVQLGHPNNAMLPEEPPARARLVGASGAALEPLSLYAIKTLI